MSNNQQNFNQLINLPPTSVISNDNMLERLSPCSSDSSLGEIFREASQFLLEIERSTKQLISIYLIKVVYNTKKI